LVFVFAAVPQWGWAPGVSGYCGETSIQSAGLYFGNWISSERVRYAGGNAEVLVNVNAHTAATALKFTIARWNSGAKKPQNAAFVAWVKSQLAAGHPVVAGLYQSETGGDPGTSPLPSSPPLSPIPASVAVVSFRTLFCAATTMLVPLQTMTISSS
jgi:hypothetical protein